MNVEIDITKYLIKVYCKNVSQLHSHAEIFSCVSDSGQFIVCTEFGSFPGAIEGIHFELQRPKYFVNLYIVLYRVAGFPPGPKNFISMFSLWAAVGGVRWGNGVESKRKD